MNSRADIRTNFLITTAVIITVALALFMSQQDGRDGESLIADLAGTTNTHVTTEAQTILLPTTTAAASDVPVTATVAAVGGQTAVSILPHCNNAPANWLPHIIHENDNIYALSIISGATIVEIAQANCLVMGQTLTGLTIYLPPQPPTRVACGPPNWWYAQPVLAGDTLYSLAVRHGTTVYAIMQANCLSSSYLVAGRTLYLPPTVITVTPPIAPTPLPTVSPTAVLTPTPTIILTATPTETAVPTSTTIPTPIPTITATAITPTPPPITVTITPPPSPTITNTPLPTTSATPTETAVLPTNTPTIAPTPTPENSRL